VRSTRHKKFLCASHDVFNWIPAFAGMTKMEFPAMKTPVRVPLAPAYASTHGQVLHGREEKEDHNLSGFIPHSPAQTYFRHHVSG
jgi:hypothetical protein